MNRSFQPDDESLPEQIANTDAAANAEALLRQFHDIHTLSDPNDLIAKYQALHATWRQCDEVIRDLMMQQVRIPIGLHSSNIDKINISFLREKESPIKRQADLVQEMRRACVTRMVAICLEKEGSERKALFRKFYSALRGTWPMSEQTDGMHVLDEARGWFYVGWWSGYR